MNQPFIRNHQYNLIKQQAQIVYRASCTASDPKVVEAVKFSALSKIMDAFSEMTSHQSEILEQITKIHTEDDLKQFVSSLEPLLEEFTSVSGKQISKLYPKVKKLKLPSLASIDYQHLTYLGWIDIATQKMFIVYELNGKLVGIEGRFTPAKKGMCFLCNRQEEVALFTAITKSRPANVSSDYYKAIGNYMCVDSAVCNKNITNVVVLEKFLKEVTGITQ